MKQRILILVLSLALLISACSPTVPAPLPVPSPQGSQAGPPRPPAQTVQEPSGLDGIGMGSSTYLRVENVEEAYREMASLGVRYIREEIPWSEAQPNPGTLSLDYRNGALATALDLAQRYDLQVVALLAYSPGFAVNQKQEFLDYWSAYVTAIVQRFGSQIDHWEIGNEMNTWWHKVRPGESFQADWYMGMLAEAHRIIKAADPTDVVIVGGLVNIDQPERGLDPFEALRKLGDLNVETYADALGLHLYWPNRLPEEAQATLVYGETHHLNLPDYTRLFINESKRHLSRDLPVWITETGVDLKELKAPYSQIDTEPEHVPAVLLARTYVHLLSIPEVRAVFWYTWENDSPDQSFALDATGKRVLQTLSTALLGSQPLGRQPVLNATGQEQALAWDYRFKRPDGGTLSYFWALDSSMASGEATLVPAGQDPVNLHNADQGMQDHPRELAPGQSFNLLSLPGILLGNISSAQQIQLGAGPQQSSGRHPLAYTKEGNIWVYYPDSQERQQVTSDGSPLGSGGPVRYQDPKISKNGEWVAFASAEQFTLYELASGRFHVIPILSSPDMVGDTLLGWDLNNRLYFTRTVGPCDLSQTPMQGPESTDVYRFDPITEATELVYSMPSSEVQGHAYWIGTDISNSGRYVSFSSAACSIGGIFTTYITDTQTGAQYHGSYGLSSVSNDESMYAVTDTSMFQHRGFVHPVAYNFANGEAELFFVAAASFIWDEPNWSYDDQFVSFNESELLDLSIQDYDINMYGTAEYKGLVTYNREFDAVPHLSFAGPSDGSTYFRAWSPYNHDIAMVRYPNGFNPKFGAELWIYSLGGQDGLLVDSGLGIGEADW